MTQVTKIQFLQALLPKIGTKETETMVNYIDHSIELNNEELFNKIFDPKIRVLIVGLIYNLIERY